MSYVRRGTEITASWPKKRGVSKSQAEQDRRNFFTAVQFAYRRLEPCTKIMLRDATAGTPLLPRDLWLSMCAGRLATIGLPNGKVVFSVANLRDTSKILDVVGQDEGDMLYRGPDYWEAVTVTQLFGKPEALAALAAYAVLATGAAFGGPLTATNLSGVNSGDETTGTVRAKLLATSGGGVVNFLRADGTWAAPPTAGASFSNSVNTSEVCSLLAYGNLATPGPVVTVTTGAEVIITLSAVATKPAGGLGNDGFASVAVSGATTIAAADANCIQQSYPLSSGGFNFQLSRTFKLSGLTPGVNTFTMKYRDNGGSNWNFANRSLTVTLI